MEEKIVLIGAGSAVFTRGLVAGLIGQGRPVVLALVDIDPQALGVAEALTRRMVAAAKAPITVMATLDQRAVLAGATAVICTIGVGGRRAWEQDVRIPRQYGLYAPVGDTVGPGGSSRALRMIPAMVAIARDVLALAPEAVFFNYSNPMAPICRAIQVATGAPVIGLCHGVVHVAAYLAETLAEPLVDLTYTAVGLNHLTWFVEVQVRGADALPRLRAIAREKVAAGVDPMQRLPDDPFAAMDWPHHNLFSWELMLKFGAFPSAMDRHTTEFFPQFFRDGDYYGQRLGVDAFSFETTIAEGDAVFDDMRRMAHGDRPVPGDALEDEQEEVLALIDALRAGRSMRLHANLPNTGQVPNLPHGAVLESPVISEHGRLRALPVAPLSPGLVGTLATRLAWVDTIVDAALTGRRDAFVQALVLDGYVDSFEMASRLADDLLAAQAPHLPQFSPT
jgi:alpha-galactosidase